MASSTPEKIPATSHSVGTSCKVGPLDFVVFGIPRSGTSALVQAINCHSDVFCGTEHLPLEYKLEDGLAPGIFLRNDLYEVNHRKVDALRLKLSRNSNLQYGNKQPRYYLKLNRLRSYNPDIRLVTIYRRISAVAASWTRRAGLVQDRWDPRATGIFAIAEAFLFACRLAEEKFDTILVNYEALFFNDIEIAVEIVKAIGLDGGSEEFRRRFLEKHFRWRGKTAEEPANTPDLADAFRRLDLEALDRLMLGRSIRATTEIRSDLATFVELHGGRLAGVMVDHLRASPDDRAAYARTWLAKLAKSIEREAPQTRRFALDLCAEVTGALETGTSDSIGGSMDHDRATSGG